MASFFGVQTPESAGTGFIVTSDGQLGFGPERCEKGDVIMIIPGGKVPYALRKMEDVKCTLRQYRLLGDAFIDGAMAGEKISHR